MCTCKRTTLEENYLEQYHIFTMIGVYGINLKLFQKFNRCWLRQRNYRMYIILKATWSCVIYIWSNTKIFKFKKYINNETKVNNNGLYSSNLTTLSKKQICRHLHLGKIRMCWKDFQCHKHWPLILQLWRIYDEQPICTYQF